MNFGTTAVTLQERTKFDNFQRIIVYQFRDGGDKQQALKALKATEQPTYALAVGGDAVLKLVIIEDMLAAGIYDKGDIGLQVSEVGSNKNLFKIGLESGLDQCLILNAGVRGPVSKKPMTCAIEAILWVVYVSSGRTTAAPRAVMRAIGLWPRV